MFSVKRQTQKWKERAQHLVEALGRDFLESIDAAQELLNEERHYANTTGDSFPLCRSLQSFSKAVWNTHAQQAVMWSTEAFRLQEADPYSWTMYIRARLGDVKSDLDETIRIAWEAIERFPYDNHTYHGLGEALRRAERLDEAEQILRQAIGRFPNEAYNYTGLSEVLKQAERLDVAEQILRQAVERFPNQAYAYTGLGQVLKQSGRLDEAEQVFAQATARFPDLDAKSATAYVRFLRNWASSLDLKNRAREATELRNKAMKKLDNLLKHQPY